MVPYLTRHRGATNLNRMLDLLNERQAMPKASDLDDVLNDKNLELGCVGSDESEKRDFG